MAVRKTDAAIAEMTIAQAMEFRKVAIAKGVSREQVDKGQPTLALALDTIKLGRPIAIVPEFMVPEGWRIHILDNVPVVQDGDWELAINNAGPNTPDNYNVRKVGHLFPPTGVGTQLCRLLLLNNAGAGWNAALTWAKQYLQLKPTSPRHVFAIGKTQPNLHKKLGMNPMWVTETTSCTFEDGRQTCYVWWVGTEREAGLRWVGHFTYSLDWFVFLCLPGPSASVFSEVSTQ